METDFDTELDEDLDESGVLNKLRKQLRETSKALKDANERESRNSAAALELAFIKAGVPETPQSKFFREHYNGDPTVEAIRSAAAEYGFYAPDTATTTSVNTIDQMSEAAMGAEGTVAPGSDDEFLSAVEKAAAEAPRGFTSQAIYDVFQQYGRTQPQ